MTPGENILIVNFDFPPNTGIGGRRWAKFAKQLALDGYHVHVIKADPIRGHDHSFWKEDVKHPNIHVYSLPRAYPELLSHPRKDLISKIKYRWYVSRMLSREKGTIYDISNGWGEALQQTASRLIREKNIRVVCATGAPWRMLYDTVKLKEKFSHLRIIIDYRDPWLNAKNYGMPGLEAKRKAEEERKQTYILQHADVVVTPYEYLSNELREYASQHGGTKARFETITHCFDPQDIIGKKQESHEGIRIVYGGDLYTGIQSELHLLSDALERVMTDQPELYQQLSIAIFTNRADDTTLNHLNCVSVLPGIGKKIFQAFSAADATLIILPSNKKNDRTTKFFEMLACRKPFIVISDEGEVTAFVRSNKLGYVLNRDGSNLTEILLDLKDGSPGYNHQFDVESYSLEKVTSQLKSYFS